MVECHLLARKIRRGYPRLIHEFVPVPDMAGGTGLAALRVGHIDRVLHGIQPFQDVAQFGAAVVVLAAILVGIDVKEDLG